MKRDQRELPPHLKVSKRFKQSKSKTQSKKCCRSGLGMDGRHKRRVT